jgi:predicted RNA-binding Zn-ribbon protein involved in translation (DUF1610 family)
VGGIQSRLRALAQNQGVRPKEDRAMMTCKECGNKAHHRQWPIRFGELLCPSCGCPEHGRCEQLEALAAEGDECAMADLFKEGCK